MKTEIKKFKRAASILRKVIVIFLWATVVMGVAATAVNVVFIAKPEIFAKLVNSGNMGVTLGLNSIIRYKLGASQIEPAKLMPIVYSMLPAILIILTALIIVLKQIIGILKTVENDCPFEEANSKRLSIIAIVMLAGSVIFRAAECAVAGAIVHAYDIANFQIVFGIDGNMMVAGFLILVLAGVFKYGSFLQKEYDTTL